MSSFLMSSPFQSVFSLNSFPLWMSLLLKYFPLSMSSLLPLLIPEPQPHSLFSISSFLPLSAPEPQSHSPFSGAGTSVPVLPWSISKTRPKSPLSRASGSVSANLFLVNTWSPTPIAFFLGGSTRANPATVVFKPKMEARKAPVLSYLAIAHTVF